MLRVSYEETAGVEHSLERRLLKCDCGVVYVDRVLTILGEWSLTSGDGCSSTSSRSSKFTGANPLYLLDIPPRHAATSAGRLQLSSSDLPPSVPFVTVRRGSQGKPEGVRGLPHTLLPTKFLLSVIIGHMESKFSDYVLVLCQKLHI